MTRKKKKISFEDEMSNLEEIVELLENGEMELEESINKYIEGMELYKNCSKTLQESRKKIEILLNVDESGNEITEGIQEELY